jgi:predicted PurR-regulated permease PerM
LRPLLRFPLRKAAIWTSIAALIYFCRDYFGVIFLTFVISYISTTIVGRVSKVFTSRKVPVLLVFLVLIGSVVGLGFATVPGAIRQGKAQLDQMRKVEDLRAFVNDRATELVDKIPVLKDWGVVEKLSDPEINKQVVANLQGSKDYVLVQLNFIWTSIWGGVLNVGLALIFSFMLVWDMPKLGRSLKQLETSRLSTVWFEVAPSVATFFRLLGRAFEAQTMIAIVNTALTSIGLLMLGIDGIGFLALIVFLCSFIPIVGMWISTVPICIVAIQGGGGVGLVAGVLVMITLVHFLEAYVLNPRIYGHHMKLHPLAVLVILYLAGETLGVWGLVVGVPLATYVWRHLIMGEAQELELSDELEPVAGLEAAATGT